MSDLDTSRSIAALRRRLAGGESIFDELPGRPQPGQPLDEPGQPAGAIPAADDTEDAGPPGDDPGTIVVGPGNEDDGGGDGDDGGDEEAGTIVVGPGGGDPIDVGPDPGAPVVPGRPLLKRDALARRGELSAEDADPAEAPAVDDPDAERDIDDVLDAIRGGRPAPGDGARDIDDVRDDVVSPTDPAPPEDEPAADAGSDEPAIPAGSDLFEPEDGAAAPGDEGFEPDDDVPTGTLSFDAAEIDAPLDDTFDLPLAFEEPEALAPDDADDPGPDELSDPGEPFEVAT